MIIVIIVIGFVAGGIMVGQTLIRRGELASVMADVNKFRNAINQFETRYGVLPGDMTNASSYWASANNGNGNGKIDFLSNGTLAAGSEEYYAWQHLSLAELILPGTVSVASTSTSNLPLSRINFGYYRVSYQSGVYGRNGHMISLNKLDMSLSPNIAHKAILSPLDTYALDLKFDDGVAATGEIMGFNEEGASQPACADKDYTASSPYGVYVISGANKDKVECKVFFIISND
jgi:hypothetical protein